MKYNLLNKLYLSFLSVFLVLASPIPILAQDNSETSQNSPRSIETWAGIQSPYDGITVRGVMTYTNGNWNARGEILKAVAD